MPDLTPDRSLRRRPPLGALERVQRAGRRRRRTILLGAASALVLLAAVPVALVLPVESRETLLTEGGSAPSAVPGDPAPSTGTAAPAAAESCPAVLDNLPGRPPTVPAPPPVGWHGALVPGQAPVAAAICRYSDASAFSGAATGREPPEQVALESERQLTGGLDDVVSDLSVPAGTEVGGCTLVGGPIVPYLLRLTYPTGTVWVGSRSDLNSCELVTNGAFTSAVYVGDQLAASFEAGAWVAEPVSDGARRSACAFGPSGRAGQERQLVPAGWTTLTVCLQDGPGQAPRRIVAERADAVAELLNALPTEPLGGFGASCDRQLEVRGDDDRTRFLHWTYPRGRAVLVIPFVGCAPSLANGSLAADATAEQQAELLRLLSEG